MKNGKKINRRQFLARSAAGAVALGTSGLLSAKTAQAMVGANDQIRIGFIGCGNMGTSHLRHLADDAKDPKNRIQTVAVCDIYKPRIARAKTFIPNARVYHDYRELLDQKDIDVVWVATPDHWHARMAMDAMEAGKDVYSEKPMARYWEEARDYYRCWERTGRVAQVGVQTTSDVKFTQAAELIKAGKLGKLVWSTTGYGYNNPKGGWKYEIDANVGPHNLDWKAFLGSATWRAYDPERFFRWRKYWDYSGGIATDLFFHALGHMYKTLGAEFPTRVTASGGKWLHPDREVPDTFMLTVDFPSRHTLVSTCTQGSTAELAEIVRGQLASMDISGRDEIVIRPERRFARGRTVEHIPVRPGTRGSHHDHRWNFLQCVRERNRMTNCNPHMAYRVAVAICLSVEAYRQNKAMRFDPVRQEIIG